MDINKFTEKAREAVTQAQSIAVGIITRIIRQNL